MMARSVFRKHLSIPGMLEAVRNVFDGIDDPIASRKLSQTDCLMAGLSLFLLKFPSLLQFEKAARGGEDPVTVKNLQTLYGIKQVPSDTAMRERLDVVDPRELRKAFRTIFSFVQRGKALEDFSVLGGHYLLAVDGTGYFSSHDVRCDNCCVKEHRDGSKTYYHQMLGAAVVHPEHGEVFPLAPEMILKEDGKKKNDCERNAARRFLDDLRREHPHLPLIVLEDGLASNGPHIKHLQSLDLRYILGAKPGDHKFLFEWVATSQDVETYEYTDKAGSTHSFRWLCGAPLNDKHFDLDVNFLEYKEKPLDGKIRTFSWVTDLPLDRSNVKQVMRAARARWRIENETFNTLKNPDGYNFEHNFGHGKNQLSSVFAMLTMLAFLIDQVQQRCCGLFRHMREKMKRNIYLWERMRSYFSLAEFPDWETFYTVIARRGSVRVIFDTS